MNRTLMRVGALAGAATLATVTAAPGYAATTAKATASAFTIGLAGEEQGSSQYTATNDGSGEQTGGTSDPQGSIPTEGALTFGVAAQEAVARDDLTSAACAGIAGDGGSVVQLGESFCLEPGEDIDLSLGALGLPDLGGGGEREQLEQALDDILGALEDKGAPRLTEGEGSGEETDDTAQDQIEDQLNNRGDQSGEGSQDGGSGDPDPEQQLRENAPTEAPSVTQPSSTGSSGSTQNASFQNASFQPAAAPPVEPTDVEELVTDIIGALESGDLDSLALKGNLGAIQAKCQANPGLSGDANLIDSRLYIEAGGREYNLLTLPVNPEPNTEITTDLDGVLNLVIDGLAGNFGDEFTDLTDEVKEQVINQVVAQISGELDPLDDLLTGTLNKQSRSNGTINVTALDLQIVPAAQDMLEGSSLASLKLGDVSCRPGSPDGPVGGVVQENPQSPKVPTVVTSGEPDSGDEGLPAGVVGGILALLGATALVGYRRVLGR